jgi:hypothetical protein
VGLRFLLVVVGFTTERDEDGADGAHGGGLDVLTAAKNDTVQVRRTVLFFAVPMKMGLRNTQYEGQHDKRSSMIQTPPL